MDEPLKWTLTAVDTTWYGTDSFTIVTNENEVILKLFDRVKHEWQTLEVIVDGTIEDMKRRAEYWRRKPVGERP